MFSSLCSETYGPPKTSDFAAAEAAFPRLSGKPTNATRGIGVDLSKADGVFKDGMQRRHGARGHPFPARGRSASTARARFGCSADGNICLRSFDIPELQRGNQPPAEQWNEMNVKGLRDFLRFAWPRARAAMPAARFHVVGSVGRILTGHEPNVRWLGHLDDLGDAYAAARLVINPAVAGTGVKIKTLEALSQLRPIVLWPSGVDGLSPELRTYCACVTDWYAFGESVIALLRDAAAGDRLIEARDTISALLSSEQAYAEFQAFLSRLSLGEVDHAPRAA